MDDVARDGKGEKVDENENGTRHSSSQICLRAARSAGVYWFLGRLKQIGMVGDALHYIRRQSQFQQVLALFTDSLIIPGCAVAAKVRVLNRKLHKLL